MDTIKIMYFYNRLEYIIIIGGKRPWVTTNVTNNLINER